MEREISSGAMLGVVLLALAAVIGIGFMVFAVAKGVSNDGVVEVQDTLTNVSEQIFEDFNQKVVTGTQVQSALETLEGKPYAVLIATRALRNGSEIASSDVRTKGAYLVSTEGKPAETFINYNAIIAKVNGETSTVPAGGDYSRGNQASEKIKYSNGAYEVIRGIESKEGSVIFDNTTAGLHQVGNAEYLNPGSKFNANIMRDSSKNIIGVVLEEI